MNWQELAALGLASFATAYLLYRGWTTWFRVGKDCKGGCGCSGGASRMTHDANGTFVPVAELGRIRREKPPLPGE
jgi:hypothetical protein